MRLKINMPVFITIVCHLISFLDYIETVILMQYLIELHFVMYKDPQGDLCTKG